MPAITAFFGRLFFVVLIVCAFAWMFSPALGRKIAKRGAISLLLFTAAVMLLPTPNQGVLVGGVHVVLVFTFVLAAFFYLFDPPVALAFVYPVFFAAGLVLLLCIGPIGLKLVTGILIVLGGFYIWRRNQ